jgi:nucleoside diphosphate kinase
VSLELPSLPPRTPASAVHISWQFAQQEHISGQLHDCGLEGEGGCAVGEEDVEAAMRTAASLGRSAASVKCSFAIDECAAVVVAAGQQQFCDTRRAEVPSWAFSAPFPSPSASVTLAIVKPDAFHHTRAILRDVEHAGFLVLYTATLTLSHATAAEFYAEHASRSFFQELLEFMTSGPCTVLLLQRVDAVKAWRELIGPTDSVRARASAPQSLRAKYGSDSQRNAFHGSDSAASAAREISIFFPFYSPSHAVNTHATNWNSVESVNHPRAISVTAESEAVSFAFTVVPSRRMKLVGAGGGVLPAEDGGAVVGDYVIQHGIWAPSSTRMFHALIGDACSAAAGALVSVLLAQCLANVWC